MFGLNVHQVPYLMCMNKTHVESDENHSNALANVTRHTVRNSLTPSLVTSRFVGWHAALWGLQAPNKDFNGKQGWNGDKHNQNIHLGKYMWPSEGYLVSLEKARCWRMDCGVSPGNVLCAKLGSCWRGFQQRVWGDDRGPPGIRIHSLCSSSLC